MKSVFTINMIVLFGLTILLSCGESNSSKQVLTHWLNGTYQAESNEGLLQEIWTHPQRDVWMAERQIINGENIQMLPPLEIKNVDDDLSLIYPYNQSNYILPSKVLDMRIFEFQKEAKDNEPHRIRFEKISDFEFRRIHYIKINGRNSIEPLEFKKIE